MITTTREWKAIYDVVFDRFNEIATAEQVVAFDKMCNRKFPQGYNADRAETVDEYKTAVALILEFVYNERMDWKHRWQ